MSGDDQPGLQQGIAAATEPWCDMDAGGYPIVTDYIEWEIAREAVRKAYPHIAKAVMEAHYRQVLRTDKWKTNE